MLRTDRVYLRRLEETDLDRCHDWINRPDIYITMGVFGPRSRHEQRGWYETVADSRTNLVFALCLVDDDLHIGNLSLFDIDYVNRNAGLTIFIAEEHQRGMGYGTDAVRLLCVYAFDHLNLHRVYCKTDNRAAGRLYEGLGFRHEGVLRQHSFQRGAYVDKEIYGVVRDELLRT